MGCGPFPRYFLIWPFRRNVDLFSFQTLFKIGVWDSQKSGAPLDFNLAMRGFASVWLWQKARSTSHNNVQSEHEHVYQPLHTEICHKYCTNQRSICVQNERVRSMSSFFTY